MPKAYLYPRINAPTPAQATASATDKLTAASSADALLAGKATIALFVSTALYRSQNFFLRTWGVVLKVIERIGHFSSSERVHNTKYATNY